MQVCAGFFPSQMAHRSLCFRTEALPLLHPQEISWEFEDSWQNRVVNLLWEGPVPSQKSHLTDTSGHHSLPKIVTGVLIQWEVQLRPHSSPLPSLNLGHQDPTGLAWDHCHLKCQGPTFAAAWRSRGLQPRLTTTLYNNHQAFPLMGFRPLQWE